MAKKVYLSPSDQTNNKYAYGDTNEAVQCGKIAVACKAALERCGFEVKLGQYQTLENACKESDNFGADIHVPIHTNAYNGEVTGTRIFCYSFSDIGYKYAKSVFDVLDAFTLGTSSNIKENQGLYEVKNPKAPTVYIEVDFHDVPRIAKWIIENTTEIGEKIAEGICNAFGVTYKAETKTVETKADETTCKLYRVQVGAYSVKANAEAMLAKLKSAGFDGYIKQD